MEQVNRRKFIEKSAIGIAGTGLLTLGSCNRVRNDCLGSRFIHHVFFWLKEPVTAEKRLKFENALKELVTVETIVEKHLGLPAPSERDVVDSSYSYSLLVAFQNKEDQDIYQKHATHLKFIKDCGDLWERVVVYDSVNM